MWEWNHMSRVLETRLVRSSEFPARPATTPADSQLNVVVIFTSVRSTVAALKEAGVLASRLNASIRLMVPQVVPYPLPLTSPPVSMDWTERRFRVIANESSVETAVRIYLCRDPFEALRGALTPRSLIVIGGPRRRWWPTNERRLAKQLRHAGHEVILIEKN
jgi:hypothetical protein